MNVLLVGGSGFIGTRLSEHLIKVGHTVTTVSRNPKSSGKSSSVGYDELGSAVQGADVVVNLAGANVADKRWTAKFRREISDSRILTTRSVVNAINESENKPRLVSMSGSGYYGNTQTPSGEYSGHGSTFLAQVCKAWEDEATKCNSDLVIVRLGVVLDKKQGALPKLVLPTKLFLGAVLGSGRQYLPWVHVFDVVSALTFFIEHPETSGVYNLASPQPVTFREFAKTLGRVLHRPVFLKIPELFIRAIKGRMTDVIVHGQRVVPTRIRGTDFTFKHPNLKEALKNILSP